METEIIKTLKQRAKKDVKTIVLPEAEDLRILEDLLFCFSNERICKMTPISLVDISSSEFFSCFVL